MGVLSRFSHVWLFVTAWTVAQQVSLSMGFSRQEILEWVAISSSSGSSQPRYWTHVSFGSYIDKWIVYHWATWEASGSGQKSWQHPRHLYLISRDQSICDSCWLNLQRVSHGTNLVLSNITFWMGPSQTTSLLLSMFLIFWPSLVAGPKFLFGAAVHPAKMLYFLISSVSRQPVAKSWPVSCKLKHAAGHLGPVLK